MTIYERIKQLRIRLGLSQEELAKKVGYEGRSAISKVENGERDISQSMIVRYAEALNVSPTYLLYGVDSGDSRDKWSNSFRDSLSDELMTIDRNDADAAGVDINYLMSVSDGEVPLTLSEACNIADDLGVSLDSMVGLNLVDSNRGADVPMEKSAPEIKYTDDNARKIIDRVRHSDGMRMLFSVTEDCTEEDIKKAVAIIKALKDSNDK